MSVIGRLVSGLLVLSVLMLASWPASTQMGKMPGAGAADAPRIPPVNGFSEGADITFFAHRGVRRQDRAALERHDGIAGPGRALAR